jgi:cytochrome c1
MDKALDKARTWMMRLSSATASRAHAARGPATGHYVQRGVRRSDVQSVIAALHSMSAPTLQRFKAAFGSRLDSVVTSVADELSRLALAFHVRLQAEVERRKAGATASGQSASDPAWGGFSPAGSEQSRLTTPEARSAWARRVVDSVNAGAQAAQPQNEAIRELFADLRENVYGLGSREAFTEKYKKHLGAEFWASSSESEQLYKALAKECSKQVAGMGTQKTKPADAQETKPAGAQQPGSTVEQQPGSTVEQQPGSTAEQETKPTDERKSMLAGVLKLLITPNPEAARMYQDTVSEIEKRGRDNFPV